MDKVAGVILAGGRSSRMGVDKATLKVNGMLLIDRMRELLDSLGIDDVYVSGDVKGYKNCIKDTAQYGGPARAIVNTIQSLKGYDAALVVPVDMPLLSKEVLKLLLKENSCYFQGYPMPIFIKLPIQNSVSEECDSVYDLIKNIQATDIPLHQQYHPCMLNLNKPEDLEKIGKNEFKTLT
jgi:molybdopterin-guanine dinucleotide biosynthesis protein A